jgi:NAD-dependent dihydropyrimidine dehydrogenase PreA subunit
MVRDIVTIDEDLCNGCGDCVPACQEEALQVIDGKVRLVSDLMCDGLGACIGHCPQGAITIEKRDAGPYDEAKVMAIMVRKGKNTIVAHLRHLKEHNETEYLNQGIRYLKENTNDTSFNAEEIMKELRIIEMNPNQGGCPGTRARSFKPKDAVLTAGDIVPCQSELRQWPVQLHLINPQAGYYKNTDVILAADCVAFALGNFHSGYLKGRSLAIACPKLDSGQDIYIEKIQALIDDAEINTLNVMIMQVPCCSGLVHLAQTAVNRAVKKVPVKVLVVGIEGEILSDKWV